MHRTGSGCNRTSLAPNRDAAVPPAHGTRPFDPKYKLVSEEGAEAGDGRPKKIDIDTMHAYRDAIRDQAERRVVEYAGILYPGPQVLFADGIEALSANPLHPEALDQRLTSLFEAALAE
ncbi:MAG: hypothetical protein FJW96_11485 [Actinobacteria bacterium]|nr:hypothetical protein [Actinomycetota bacterium]